MRSVLWVAAMVGCAARVEPDETPAGTGTPRERDPKAEALRGCAASSDLVDDALGTIASLRKEYDNNGDIVLLAADYVDDEVFYDYETTYAYGEAHQIVQQVVTYTRIDGWTYDYTWEDGQRVRSEWDYASDGALDEIGAFVYDGDQMVRWEWDYDADGTIEDWADYTWTASDGGWDVVGDGVDPNGPYLTEEWRDAELRPVDYHYEDSVGATRDWTVEFYSALGLPGSGPMIDRLNGELVMEERNDRTFDDLGRLVEDVHQRSEYDAGTLIGSFVRTESWTYDCPQPPI